MKKFFSYFFTILILFSFALPVFSQGVKDSNGPLTKVAEKSGISENNLGNVAGNVVAAILSLIGVIFLVLMVYAGILWMTARGNDSQIDKAKSIIIASIIGLFIVVSAYAITKFITARFS
ncbi:MAG: hypothetical protein WC070_02595 [Candidatus Magasanikbacteria bacterium]